MNWAEFGTYILQFLIGGFVGVFFVIVVIAVSRSIKDDK